MNLIKLKKLANSRQFTELEVLWSEALDEPEAVASETEPADPLRQRLIGCAVLSTPVIVLAIQPTFHLAKVVSGLLENELQRDYIQVANGKGLTWAQMVRRHAWPNMLSPVLVTMGEALRLMIGALVIVEAVFLWPGVGRLLLYSLGLRLDAGPPGVFFGNAPLIALLAVIVGSWLLLADLLAAVLAYHFDPRVGEATA